MSQNKITHSFVLTLFILISLMVPRPGFSQTTVSVLEPSNADSIPLFTMIELGIQPGPEVHFNNPYDENDIDIEAEIKHVESNTVQKADAFYYKAFTENDRPIGGYSVKWKPIETELPWRVRFTAKTSGRYEVRFNIKTKNNPERPSDLDIPLFEFTAIDTATSPGYLFFPEGKKHLSFTNGDPFFAMGLNLSFYGDNQYRLPAGNKGQPGPNQTGSFVYAPSTVDYYKTHISKAVQKGVNYVRLIFAPWTFELEWEGGICGNYDAHQYQLSDLDQIVRFCEENGVYLQICLYDHTAFKTAERVNDPGLSAYEWKNCPIKKDLNLTDPASFYSNKKARELFKRRIRYVLSRWGYSPNFAAVELVSETNNFPDFWGTPENNFKDSHINVVNEWCVEMAKYCKTVESRLLVTTGSHGFWGVHPSWAADAMDFASPHTYYSYKNAAYLNAHMADAILANIIESGGKDKAIQYGETGQRLTIDEAGKYIRCFESDITQIHFHNTMWSTSFMGSFGTSLPWSRTEIFAKWGDGWGEGYRYFKPLSKFFAKERLHDAGWQKIMNEQRFSKSIKEVPAGHQNQPEIVKQESRELPKPHPFYQGITTKTADGEPGIDVAAFGIKSDKKILGWVQNMNNYWYNINETKGQKHFDGECRTYFEHPDESKGIRVNPIEGATLTVNDLKCNGTYDIEWWSAYDGFDTDGDGNPMDQGGRILNPAMLVDAAGQLLPDSVRTQAGSLTVTVPKLAPLTPWNDYRPEDQVFAPDYGFKFIYRNGSGGPPSVNWASKPLFDKQQVIVSESDLTIDDNGRLFLPTTDGNILIISGIGSNCMETENLGFLQNGEAEKVAPGTRIRISQNGSKIAYLGKDGRLRILYRKEGVWGISTIVDPEFSGQPFQDVPPLAFGKDDLLFYFDTNNSIVAADLENLSNPVILRPFKVQINPVFSQALATDGNGNVIGISREGEMFRISVRENQVSLRNVTGQTNKNAILADPSSGIAVSTNGFFFRTNNGAPAKMTFRSDSVSTRVIPIKGKNRITEGSALETTKNDELVYTANDGTLRFLQTKNDLFKLDNPKTLLKLKPAVAKLAHGKAFTVNPGAEISRIFYIDQNQDWHSITIGDQPVFENLQGINASARSIKSISESILVFENENSEILLNYQPDPCNTDPCETVKP